MADKRRDERAEDAATVPPTRGSNEEVGSSPTVAAGTVGAEVSGLDATVAPESAADADADDGALPIVQRGRFTVGAEVARGGMGRILAAQDRRFDRPVAVKELLDRSPAATRRFQREALVTGRLQHPAIVPVYEAGRWPSGEPFFAMKMVAGTSLEQVIRGARALADRLALLPNIIAVAEAMAYAHSKRIVHRDLKPANVLVGDFGETVVIDWGLAKDLSEGGGGERDGAAPVAARADPATADLTVAGSVMGTPAYMPPEQAASQPVDERADVYALGAILYHALAGVPPYTGKHSGEVLARVLGGPPVPLNERQAGIPADLLTVVAKAMAAEPDDRYPTARELAEELRRFQTGKLVSAHAYSAWALLRRWLRRHRVTVAVAAVLLAGLALTAVVSVRRVVRERDRASAAQRHAEAAQQRAEAAGRQANERSEALTLAQARSWLERDPAVSLAWLQTLPPESPRWPAARAIAIEARQHGIGRELRGPATLEGMVAVSADGRRLVCHDEKTVYVWDLASGQRRSWVVLGGPIWNAALAPDGSKVAVTGQRVQLWDLEANRTTVLSAEPAGPMVFSPTGTTLAVARQDGPIDLIDLASAQARRLSGPTGAAALLRFSADGARLVSLGVGDDKRAWLWDVAGGTGRALALGPGDSAAYDVDLSADGARLAVSLRDKTVRLVELASGRDQVISRDVFVLGVSFSPDGRQLAFAGGDGTARLWDGTALKTLAGHEAAVMAVDFAPDGRRVLTGSADGTVRLWHLGTRHSEVLRGHHGRVAMVAFAGPDAAISASGDGAIRVWRLADLPVVRKLDGAQLDHIALSPGADLIAMGGSAFGLWDRATGERRLEEAGEYVSALAFSPSGRLVAAAGRGRVRVWPTAGGPARVLATSGNSQYDLAFSPDERLLAAVGAGPTEVTVWDLASGEPRLLPTKQTQAVLGVAFSPDSRLVASASQDASVQLGEAAGGEPRLLSGHTGALNYVAFSPDGRRLLSAGPSLMTSDQTIRLWDLASGTAEVIETKDFSARPRLSPDGRRLAYVSEREVMLRDLADGTARALGSHDTYIAGLAFAPDSRTLASASADQVVKLWDVASGEGAVLRARADSVGAIVVGFTPDSAALVLVAADGTARSSAVALPSAPAELAAWLRAASSFVIGPDGRPVLRGD